MPRRRAVRLIGASLAAAALPGLGPRVARGASRAGSVTCARPYKNQCTHDIEDPSNPTGYRFETYCCGPPMWQYQCGDVHKGDCLNRCPSRNPVTGQSQFPCTAKRPDARGTINGDCCPKGWGCDEDTGQCLQTCASILPGSFRCRKTCCPPHSRCQGGTCVAQCSPGWTECGRTHCCSTRWKCCPHPAHCCAPTESCCGDDCCPKGKFCCDGGGNSTICCDDDEYCLHSVPVGVDRGGAIGQPGATRCAPKCNPVNRCGDQCCGRGYRCARRGPKKGKCVLNLPSGG